MANATGPRAEFEAELQRLKQQTQTRPIGNEEFAIRSLAAIRKAAAVVFKYGQLGGDPLCDRIVDAVKQLEVFSKDGDAPIATEVLGNLEKLLNSPSLLTRELLQPAPSIHDDDDQIFGTDGTKINYSGMF
jgi:hypothetical protein